MQSKHGTGGRVMNREWLYDEIDKAVENDELTEEEAREEFFWMMKEDK